MDYWGFMRFVDKVFDGRMMAYIRKKSSSFLKGCVLYQDKTPDISTLMNGNNLPINTEYLSSQKRTKREQKEKSLIRKILPD